MPNQQRDELWDFVADKFNTQPRPNDYVDDAGYDEAAAGFIDELVDFIQSQIESAVLEARIKFIEQILGIEEWSKATDGAIDKGWLRDGLLDVLEEELSELQQSKQGGK